MTLALWIWLLVAPIALALFSLAGTRGGTTSYRQAHRGNVDPRLGEATHLSHDAHRAQEPRTSVA